MGVAYFPREGNEELLPERKFIYRNVQIAPIILCAVSMNSLP